MFDSQCYGGASRVCVETARCAEGLFDSLWGIEATSNAYLAEWLGLPVEEELATDAKPLMLRRFWGKRTGRPAETLAERNRRRSLKMAREKKPDLIFATYYDPFWVEEKRDARLVVIVHDLIHETFPEFFNINCEVTQRKRLLVEAADHLFAVSLTTKDALVRLWSVRKHCCPPGHSKPVRGGRLLQKFLLESIAPLSASETSASSAFSAGS